MTTSTTTPTSCINADQPDERFLINWGNGRDRDVFTAQDILGALNGNEAMRVSFFAMQQAHERLGSGIDTWVRTHKDAIRSCWISERDGALLLLVVSKAGAYDEELHDSLIDFAADINQVIRDSPIRLRSLFLPGIGECPEMAFLSPQMQHRLYPASTG